MVPQPESEREISVEPQPETDEVKIFLSTYALKSNILPFTFLNKNKATCAILVENNSFDCGEVKDKLKHG